MFIWQANDSHKLKKRRNRSAIQNSWRNLLWYLLFFASSFAGSPSAPQLRSHQKPDFRVTQGPVDDGLSDWEHQRLQVNHSNQNTCLLIISTCKQAVVSPGHVVVEHGCAEPQLLGVEVGLGQPFVLCEYQRLTWSCLPPLDMVVYFIETCN